jgi:acid phosphatase (class A)
MVKINMTTLALVTPLITGALLMLLTTMPIKIYAQSAAPNNVAQASTTLPPSLPTLAAPIFITPTALRLAEYLPAYPLPNSLADLADIDVVLNLQRTRSKADIDAAAEGAMLSAATWLRAVLDKVASEKYSAAQLTKTVALLDQIQSDLRGVNRAANAIHPYRLRPAERDTRIKPSLPPGRVQTSSFPSANATTLFVWRDVLTSLMPAHAESIALQVEHSAWLRVVSGLHFPTDVAGSRQVAKAAYAQLAASPAYGEALAVVKKEY